MRSNSSAIRRTLRELERHGLLLLSDPAFLNVATLVVGKPVRGSWWGHARAHEIYDLEHRLREHADVVRTKLVSGKDTFVHRRLWPARTAQIPWNGGARKDSPGEAARELERRLLAVGEEVHTETGAHAKRLEAWGHRAKRIGLSTGGVTFEQGKNELETVVASVNGQFHANGRLPWQARRAMTARA